MSNLSSGGSTQPVSNGSAVANPGTPRKVLNDTYNPFDGEFDSTGDPFREVAA